MPQWTPDPTFYPSPKMAMEAPPETLAYLAMLDPTRQRPDAMAPASVTRTRGWDVTSVLRGHLYLCTSPDPPRPGPPAACHPSLGHGPSTGGTPWLEREPLSRPSLTTILAVLP